MSEKSGGRSCDQCHTPATPDAKFCAECGNKLTKECAKCRSLILNDVNFCSSCQQNQKEQIHCILCATALSDNTDYCYLCSCPQKLNSISLKECAKPSCQTHLLYDSVLCYKCRSEQPISPPMPPIVRELSQPLQPPFTGAPKGMEAKSHPSQSSIPGALSQEHLTPVKSDSSIPGASSQEQPTPVLADEIATADVTLQLSQSSISGTSSQEQSAPVHVDEIATADETLQLSQSSIPGTSSQEQSTPVHADEIATADVTLQSPLLSIPGVMAQEQSAPIQAEGLPTTEVLSNIPDKAAAKSDGTLPIDTYESEQQVSTEIKTRSSQSMSERPHFAIDIIQASENTGDAVDKINDLEETKSCDEDDKNKITNVIETSESNEDDHNVIEEKRTRVDAEEDKKAGEDIGNKMDTTEAKVETKANDEKYEQSQDTPTVGSILTSSSKEKMPIATIKDLSDMNGTELTCPNERNENLPSTVLPSVPETKEIDEQKLSMLLKFL